MVVVCCSLAAVGARSLWGVGCCLSFVGRVLPFCCLLFVVVCCLLLVACCFFVVGSL